MPNVIHYRESAYADSLFPLAHYRDTTMLQSTKTKTVNGVKFQFPNNVQSDRITVTILQCDNSMQLRRWNRPMKRNGIASGKTVAECFANVCESYGLKYTCVDTCGLTASYSVSGLVASLEELINGQYVILKIEYRNATVSNGGRPMDYVIVSDADKPRESVYIPFPHGRTKQKQLCPPMDKTPMTYTIAKDATGPFLS